MRPSPQFGFSRDRRLRHEAQIISVLAHGRAAGLGGVRLHSTPNECGPRLGAIAGRRAWPRAVDRNRFRRLARETFRLLQHRLQQRDYIIRARNPQPGKPSRIEIQTLLGAWCGPEAR